MYTILILLHIVICAALIISVLLQSAKGEGLAGAFGGSSLTGTVFGGRGAATFLSKATTILAVAFMASCIVLTFVSPGSQTASVLDGSSAVEEAVREGQVPAPNQPAVAEPATNGQGSTAPTEPGSDLFDDAQPAGDQSGSQPAEGGGEQTGGEQQPQTEPDGGGN